MNPFAGVIDRVIDGDTIWVRVRIRTRSSAPPVSTEEGKKDKQALSKRFPKGRRVTVDPIVTDQYGRIVATLTDA
jgi:endonuclease YncB( thermonuclease family)